MNFSTLKTSRARSLLQWIFLGIILVLIVLYLKNQWATINWDELHVNWGLLVVSQIILVIGTAMLPIPSIFILQALDESLPKVEIWRIFYFSNVAKYLPGGIWALPGRIFLYQQTGITPLKSAWIVFWEVLLTVCGATFVALLSYSIWIAHFDAKWVITIIMLGLCLFAGGLFWFQSAMFQTVIKHIPLPASFRELILQAPQQFQTGQILRFILLFSLAWFAIGLSFAVLVQAVSASILPIPHWLELIGLHSLAWVIGFLFIFSPGGIGVREGIFILGLGTLFAQPIPTFCAIFARITWTTTELISVLCIYFLSRKSKKLHDSKTTLAHHRSTDF